MKNSQYYIVVLFTLVSTSCISVRNQIQLALSEKVPIDTNFKKVRFSLYSTTGFDEEFKIQRSRLLEENYLANIYAGKCVSGFCYSDSLLQRARDYLQKEYLLGDGRGDTIHYAEFNTYRIKSLKVRRVRYLEKRKDSIEATIEVLGEELPIFPLCNNPATVKIDFVKTMNNWQPVLNGGLPTSICMACYKFVIGHKILSALIQLNTIKSARNWTKLIENVTSASAFGGVLHRQISSAVGEDWEVE